MGNPKLLRVNAVLEMLGVGRSTLYRWIKSGTFPAPRVVGGSSTMVFWTCEEVEEWIVSRCSGTLDNSNILSKLDNLPPKAPKRQGAKRKAGIQMSLF